MTTAAAVLLTAATPREYRADTQVFAAATAPAANANELALADAYVQARVQSYPSIATSPMVTEPVVDELGLSLTPSELGDRITASAGAGTVLITVSVTDPDPVEAARVADAVAAKFADVVEDVERTPEGRSRVKLTVTGAAQVPSAAVSPQPALNIALGLVLGLGIGIGAALLRGMLDTTFRSADVLAGVTGSPVLATVRRDRSAGDHPLVIRSGSQGHRAEAFRQLRTNLRYVAVDDPPRTIAVTSALPAEGKTSTALNLAAALAEAGQRVCLVEADLRQPTLASSLGLVAEVGLTSVLVGATSVDDALQYINANLAVLTSGALPPNPSEVLDSLQARGLIDHLSKAFDYTIVDTAPLLPVTDGVEVATMTDATLLVTRAGKTTHGQVRAAVAALAKVDIRTVGAILNVVK